MLRAFAFVLLLTAALAANAQYPVRPILLVVPYSAGSDADLAARNLAQHAARYLDGQTLVVMNQPGASGSIGAVAVKDAAPDGYRLLLARTAQVILRATDSKTPYRVEDFTFISVLETNPFVCAVKSDAPYGNMKDLVADIRKRPGKLNFATVGEGTLQFFSPQYLFSLTGLAKDAASGIPYKGSGDLVVSLLGGHTQFACSNVGTLLPQIKAGALKPLMAMTREPLKDLPNVPTARSLGWPEMEQFAAWSALAGPANLPHEVVARWTDVFAKLAKDPAWLAGVDAMGGIPAVRRPAETTKFVRAQNDLYEKLAQRLGLRQ